MAKMYEGQPYWYIQPHGVECYAEWANSSWDRGCLSIGNLFPSEDACKARIVQLKKSQKKDKSDD